MRKRWGEITLMLAQELKIRGPFNIQFIVTDKPYILELNLRTSRSMPFSSKSRGVNLMELSAQAVLDGKLNIGVEDEVSREEKDLALNHAMIQHIFHSTKSLFYNFGMHLVLYEKKSLSSKREKNISFRTLFSNSG